MFFWPFIILPSYCVHHRRVGPSVLHPFSYSHNMSVVILGGADGGGPVFLMIICKVAGVVAYNADNFMQQQKSQNS